MTSRRTALTSEADNRWRTEQARRPRIGVALGAGAARGWAHIGVLRALDAQGLQPDVVCGTSVGALVGAAYVSGQMDRLEDWVTGLQWRDVVRYLDVRLRGGGLIEGRKLLEVIQGKFRAADFEELDRPFGVVATDLYGGQEVWLREGSVWTAVRASISLPGLFSPAQRNGAYLVDGGLVNPVPVSLCRVLGAEVVIAVDLNADLLKRGAGLLRPRVDGWGDDPSVMSWDVRRWLFGEASDVPSILEVLSRSIHVMQVRITRSRMAGDPPDVHLRPFVANLGLMEFHRAEEAIAEGRRVAAGVARDLELH